MRSLLLIALSFLSISALFAQSDRGVITGTISDSTGALIPGARVVLTNANTGANSETVATGTGNYTVLSLPAGTYTLKVTHPGFTAYQQNNIQVQVAVTTRVEVVLAVGSAAESVQVFAEATQLKNAIEDRKRGAVHDNHR
jgi:hypothetical protein